ncbi:MAG: sulfatase-like hydrolase/transferase [Rubripirellula sp.]
MNLQQFVFRLLRRIQPNRFMAALCVLTLSSTSFLSAAAPAPRPNVVILFTDDQGTLDANCYGSDDLITPNIDALAKQGVRFTQAYAHTVCCPSRAALMTGRHPQRSGVHFWTQGDMNGPDGINMMLKDVTLAEAMQSVGYRTGLFGKWHLGAHRDCGPKKQGFDEFFGIRDGFIDNYNHYFLHRIGFHDLYEGTNKVEAPGEYFPEMMVSRAEKFIAENRGRPFLLYVPFNIPHYPEQSLREHQQLYSELESPARRAYGAMVTTTDHFIGRIVKQLESVGVLDNTIVIYMSDNGHSNETRYRIQGSDHVSGYPEGHFYGASGAGNTGRWIGHKGKFLEGGIRVPAIIRYPKQLPVGETRDQIVTAMDWYPTVMELCEIELGPDAPKLDGFSLVPICKNVDANSRYDETLHFQWGKNWAVREGDWKLIGAEGKKNVSLVSLADAAPEATNHAEAHPEVVQRLRKQHEAWAIEVAP